MQASSSPTSLYQYCERCGTPHLSCGGSSNQTGLFIETRFDRVENSIQNTHTSTSAPMDLCLAAGSPVSPGTRFATLMGHSQDLSPSTSDPDDCHFTTPSTGDTTTTTITDFVSPPKFLSGVLPTRLPSSPTIRPFSLDWNNQSFNDRFHHLNPSLRLILDRILSSPFRLRHTKEPRIESPYGQYLCSTNTLGICFPESEEEKTKKGSIYQIFVDVENSQCLICEKTRRSKSRLLECVRRDLEHRPYWCSGVLVGCRECRQTSSRAHFFSRRLLDNHIRQQLYRRVDARTHQLVS